MNIVRVGVGVVVFKEDKILLGKRKSVLGNGCWSLPGGHLEFGESFEECARREVLEETGLQITCVVQGPLSNDIFLNEDKHYITILMVAKHAHGEPRVCEPEKCEVWQWFDPCALPTPLFLPLENCIKAGLDFNTLCTMLSRSDIDGGTF